MKRRAFLAMCAAALVPRRPLMTQYRGPRTAYAGLTYHWRVTYVTAFGETIALPSLHPDITAAWSAAQATALAALASPDNG